MYFSQKTTFLFSFIVEQDALNIIYKFYRCSRYRHWVISIGKKKSFASSYELKSSRAKHPWNYSTPNKVSKEIGSRRPEWFIIFDPKSLNTRSRNHHYHGLHPLTETRKTHQYLHDKAIILRRTKKTLFHSRQKDKIVIFLRYI